MRGLLHILRRARWSRFGFTAMRSALSRPRVTAGFIDGFSTSTTESQARSGESSQRDFPTQSLPQEEKMAATAITLGLELLPEVPALVSLISNVVTSIEAFFSKTPKGGAKKKQAALAAVGDVLNIYQTIQPVIPRAPVSPVSSSELQSAISSAIDSVVLIANLIGAFQHSPSVPASAPSVTVAPQQ